MVGSGSARAAGDRREPAPRGPRTGCVHGLMPPAGARQPQFTGRVNTCTSGRRNNERIQAATPLPRVRIASGTPDRIDAATGARSPVGALRAVGALGLLGVLTTVFL